MVGGSSMAPETTSTDWIVNQVRVYQRKKVDKGQRWWKPWLWRGILWGIPIVLVWGIAGVFLPVVMAEIRYQWQLTQKNVAAVMPEGVMPHLSWQPLPAWVTNYALEIPKIGVQEPVVEAVDATNKNAYMSALKQGVAHAAGTGLPGKRGVQYYFAHSSGLPFWGSRAVVFALLNKLEYGDEVIVYRENNKYVYKVIEKQVVQADDVSWLKSEVKEERVVLQTCWPIGTDWKRLLVVAAPIEEAVSGVDRGERFGKISIAMRGTK